MSMKKIRGALLQRRGPAKELRRQVEEIDQRLKRYYDAFEEGAVTPIEVGDRVRELKQQKAKLDEELATRTVVPELPPSLTRPERIEEIQREFRQALRSGSPQLKKNYLGILLEEIVLDGQKVTVRTKNEGVMSFVEQREAIEAGEVAPVLSSIQKWRPICVVVEKQFRVFGFRPNRLNGNVLRFNPIRIAEWLAEVLHRPDYGTQRALSRDLDVDRSRIGQFLSLLRLSSGHLSELKAVKGLTEYQLRRIVVMTPNRQEQAIRALIR